MFSTIPERIQVDRLFMAKARTVDITKDVYFDEFRKGNRNAYVIAKLNADAKDLAKGSLMFIKTEKGTSLPMWRQEKDAISFMVRNKEWLTGHKVIEITNGDLDKYFLHYEKDKRHTLIALM